MFFGASGLRINMCKSKIMGVNVVDGKVKNAAVKLGCLVLKTPFTYLGTKVGDIMSRKHAWKEVVDKVLFRLSRWKMKILCIGGRFALLKSVLGSMSIFHMSIFKVPLSILKTLESIRSWFFNGQDPKSKKASWVKWNNVLTPKDKGGLRAIHGEDGSLDKDDYIRLELGNGNNTRFWDDKWYEGGVIKELFPRVYNLELDKNSSVSTKMNAPSLDNSFRRRVRNGIEEMQYNSLVEISRMNTLVQCEDRYVWTLESDGVFRWHLF
nr:RNA-directed DNA polymerase, eukaryota, reverse transcriptase zinc-binding domain protein [Tanacetum cinerariifolium]